MLGSGPRAKHMKVPYGWEENFWHRVILSLLWQQPLLFPYWVSSQFSWDVWLKVLVRDGLCWGSLKSKVKPVKDLGIWKITISKPLILVSVNVQMLFCSTDWYYCYPLVKCHTHAFHNISDFDLLSKTGKMVSRMKKSKWRDQWNPEALCLPNVFYFIRVLRITFKSIPMFHCK